MHLIVEFTGGEEGDKEVEIVPEQWIQKDNREKCWWPHIKSSEKQKIGVKNCWVPDEKKWTLYDCRILGSYGNFH